jgi:glycosyltransferase involved in cell wall biosynthesis
LSAVKKLIGDEGLRQKYGKNARRYAESTFDIEKITDKFEEIFRGMGES